MATAGQMNIRLDTALKAKGDSALAAAGFNPSQAVRALWELAVRYKDTPAKLVAILNPDKVSEEEAALEAERQRKLALVHEWDKKMEAFYQELGIKPDPNHLINKLSYKQLRELAYLEDAQEELGLTDKEIMEWVNGVQ